MSAAAPESEAPTLAPRSEPPQVDPHAQQRPAPSPRAAASITASAALGGAVPLSHPSARTHRDGAVLRLQRGGGNAAVAREIAVAPPPAVERVLGSGPVTIDPPDSPAEQRAEAVARAAAGAPADPAVPPEDAAHAAVQTATGRDLRSVRIRADADADAAARSLGAEAFTTGGDVFVRRDRLRPETQEGRRLIAHELAHAAEAEEPRRIQRQTGGGPGITLPPPSFGDVPPGTGVRNVTDNSWAGGRTLHVDEAFVLPQEPPREGTELLAPRVVYVRRIHIHTETGAEADVTIRGEVPLSSVPAGLSPAQVPAAAAVPGHVGIGYTFTGRHADGTTVIGTHTDHDDGVSLRELAARGPGFVHLGLTPEDQYQAVVDALNTSIPVPQRRAAEDAAEATRRGEEREVEYPTREQFERMSEDEKADRFWRLVFEQAWRDFSVPKLLLAILVGVAIGALAIAAIVTGAELLIALFAIATFAVLGYLLYVLIRDLVRDLREGDYAQAAVGVLKNLLLVAAVILGAAAVVVLLLGGGAALVTLLVGLALFAVVGAVILMIVRLVLDRNDAVSSRDSGTFRRKVQDAANTVNDIVTTIIVTIVTVVLGRAGGRLIPGRGPVTPPRETLLDVPPGQGEEVPPPPEQQGEEPAPGQQQRPPAAERLAQQRAAAARQAQAERINEGIQRVDREIAAGTHRRAFTQAELDWLNADPRNKQLAYDPDLGSYRVGEAQAALAAEQQGVLQGPVTRSLEPGTDFVDGAGRAWSFKGTGPAEPVADIVDRIATESRAGRNVLGDLRGLNAADRAAVEAGVRQDLQGRPGTGEVRFLPPDGPPPGGPPPGGPAPGGPAGGPQGGAPAQ